MRAIVIAVAVGGWATAGAVDAQTLPACTPAQTEQWTQARQSLGITAVDEARTLSNRPAKRFDVLRNWYPLDGAKHTVCGVLKKWSLFNGTPFTRGELDAHPYIVPGIAYEHFVQAIPNRSQESLEDCDGEPCIWGEVTGPDAFTRWFFNVQDLTTIPGTASCDCDTNPACCSKAYINDVACAYGPFVAERAHGWRPEIHPLERFWASTSRDGRPVVDVVIVQDSSGRFEQPDDFFRGIDVPTWRPWAPQRLEARLGLAYEMKPGENVEFSLARQFDAGTPGPFDPVAHPFPVAGGQVAVRAPQWMKPANEACLHNATSVRGLVWLTVPLTRQPSASARANGGVLVMEVTRTGGIDFPTDQLRAPARFTQRVADIRRTSKRAERQTSDEAVLVLDVVKVESAGRSSTDITLPGVRKQWGVEEGAGTVLAWHAAQRYALWAVARYEGRGEVAERKAEELNRALQQGKGRPISVTWRFDPAVLDNPPPGGEVRIGRSRQPFQYHIELYGADLITTSRHSALDRPRPIRGQTPLIGPRAAALTRVFIEVPDRVHESTAPLTANLVVSAELRDADGRVGTFNYQLPTHTPASAGAGLEANVLSDRLLRTLARWIRVQRGLNVPEPDILSRMTGDWQLDFGAAANHSLAQIRSRATRLFGLAAVEDGDLSADEFTELLRLSLSYATERWP